MIYAAWVIFGPLVSAPENKYFYINTGAEYNQVKASLKEQEIISGTFFFDIIAKQARYDKQIKAGKYEIKNGMSLVNLVRMLKAGRQSPVRLVINKIRTKEDFAGKIGQQFEADSLEAEPKAGPVYCERPFPDTGAGIAGFLGSGRASEGRTARGARYAGGVGGFALPVGHSDRNTV